MRSIRVRLFLLLSLLFAVTVGLNLLSYTQFLELRDSRKQIELGNQISLSLNSVQDNPRLTEEQKQELQMKIQSLKPVIRKSMAQDIFAKLSEGKKTTFKNHRENFYLNEVEFQRFTLGKMNHLEEKIIFLSGLSGIIMLFGFLVLHSFLKRIVVLPIQELSSRMMDFLHNRFTYRFDAPKNDEIGDLHSTFNSLAQRVINHTDELTSLDQAKSDFLSIASHELRTPLTSIKGSLSLLRGGIAGDLNEVSAELLGIAEIESDRLIRLINDLLDLAKIEAGKLPLQTDWVSAQELVKTTFDSLMGLSQSAEVDLVADVESPHIQVRIDRDRVQQVLTNLMSNAIKFSPRGDSVILKVKINGNDQITFEVKDHGKGIDPHDQQLIFQKFRQATSASNPLVKGTGLGLAIARALVEEHGGQIGLKSTPGEGSTFYFTLPEWRLHNDRKSAEAS